MENSREGHRLCEILSVGDKSETGFGKGIDVSSEIRRGTKICSECQLAQGV